MTREDLFKPEVSVHKHISKFRGMMIKDVCSIVSDRLKEKANQSGRSTWEATLEDIWEFVDKAFDEMWKSWTTSYRFKESETEVKEAVRAFKKDVVDNAPAYQLYFGYTDTIFSREEISRSVMKTLNEIEEKLNSMTPMQKFLFNMEHRKKAPTIKYGLLALIPIMFFEGFFYLRWELWFVTIGAFFYWRRKEIEKFNGGKH